MFVFFIVVKKTNPLSGIRSLFQKYLPFLRLKHTHLGLNQNPVPYPLLWIWQNL